MPAVARETIRQAYAAGAAARDLAREHGVSQRAIYDVLGVAPRHVGRMTEADVAAIVALDGSGMMPTAIAEETGWSRGGVRHVLAAYAVRLTDPQRRALAQRLAGAEPVRAIAADLGLSTSALGHLARRLGLPRRR